MEPLYRVRTSKRAKRLALRLDPIERVFELVVPSRCSMKSAYKFADQHEDWMAARINDLPTPVPFQHGSTLPLNGSNVEISLKIDPNRKNISVHLSEKKIEVLSPHEDISARVKRWLKKYAKDILEDLSKEKAQLINKQVQSVSVRDTKSRWGSCSSDGSLSYSWRLIFAPPEAIDYVVGHEVAHLVHLDHSKDFWKLCRELSENFVDGQYWMRNHGQELMKYGAIT